MQAFNDYYQNKRSHLNFKNSTKKKFSKILFLIISKLEIYKMMEIW